jgi:hypothetical protein
MKILTELVEAIFTVLAALIAIGMFLAIVVGVGYVMGWIFAVLWNNVISFLTGVPELTAWQGLAFLVLLNIVGAAFSREKKA